MNRIIFLVSLFSFFFSCNQTSKNNSKSDHIQKTGKGALLTTNFESFEELKKIIEIEYKKKRKPSVQVTHSSNGQKVTSILHAGINERDIKKTRRGNLWDKIKFTFKSPYFVRNRKDLMKVFILSRRKHKTFGGGDLAFYDIAKILVDNISETDKASMNKEDLSEKGYLNTFIHVLGQAMMTSLFSETFADFVADTHERTNMEELITGEFTATQLADIKNGPVDNYIDIVNNEWGQELGKVLSQKYQINRETSWTPELLANYLNDIQNYFSWALQIGFKPNRPTDESIERFSIKINRTKEGLSGVW